MNKSARFFVGILGFIFLIFGIMNLVSGFAGLLHAEPIIFITVGVESGFIDVERVSERDFTLFMVLRVVIGFIFVLIGNSLLFNSTQERMFHPRCGDVITAIRKN